MSETEEEVRYEFDAGFQAKILNLMLRDTKFALRAKDLVKPEFFTEAAMGALVRLAQEHVQLYRSAPDLKILPTLIKDAIAAKRIRPDMIPEIKSLLAKVLHADLSNPDYVRDKIVEFAQHQAYEKFIMDSVAMLEKGDFESIKKAMKEAQAVGASANDVGYDYFAEIRGRSQMREDFVTGKIVKRGITTGYPKLDPYLYHMGWGRRELSLLGGAAKSGKTIGLGDFSKNAAIAGYNAFYGSCEVSTQILSERLDASVSETLMRELNKDYAKVESAVSAIGAKSAKLMIHDYPSGSLKPSHLFRTLDQYRADGVTFDLITVDYADIMAAEYRSDSLIENMRSIYIDLRAIAYEFDAAVLTATQINREGAKSTTAKATDVAEDYNKVRTADVFITINASEAEKLVGECRLFWAASRTGPDGFTLRIKQDRERMKFISAVLGTT